LSEIDSNKHTTMFYLTVMSWDLLFSKFIYV
jgi:hypothetical protein